MTTIQELPLWIKQQTHPSEYSTREMVLTLKQFNALGKRWVKGKELCEAIGWPDHENSRRKLRGIAEASNGVIISSNDGYALIGSCTPEEVRHAVARIRHQGRLMIARSIKIERAYHRYGKIEAVFT